MYQGTCCCSSDSILPLGEEPSVIDAFKQVSGRKPCHRFFASPSGKPEKYDKTGLRLGGDPGLRSYSPDQSRVLPNGSAAPDPQEQKGLAVMLA
jgi:hypothetical protein